MQTSAKAARSRGDSDPDWQAVSAITRVDSGDPPAALIIRRGYRLLLGVLLLAAPAPALAGITCPLKIEVTQQLAEQGAGWKIGSTGWPAALTALAVFDGKPESHYALVQDDERQDEKTWTVIWNLPPKPHPYWITCRYANTTVTLSRPLPATVTRCELVHDLENTSADGGLLVRSMDCGPAD